MVRCDEVDQTSLEQLPGERLGLRIRGLVVTRKASGIHLEESTRLAPGGGRSQRVESVRETISFGVCDDDLAASLKNLFNHIVVSALEIESKLDEQIRSACE